MNICATLDNLSQSAAGLLAAVAADSIAQRGVCTVALAGGSTPATLYRLLGQPPFQYLMRWEQIHLFWSDERCVPPDHPESNFLLAKASFLDAARIRPENIHRMRGEDDPVRAAEDYERAMRDFFETSHGFLPQFDLVLLGMGEDGHTASLFPRAADLSEKERWVIASEKPGGWRRISLTLPILNAARNVAFLISGAGKADMVWRAVGEPDPEVPASLVRPYGGKLFWIVDEAAGSTFRARTR
jgi:6-phosphogluconolactonase